MLKHGYKVIILVAILIICVLLVRYILPSITYAQDTETIDSPYYAGISGNAYEQGVSENVPAEGIKVEAINAETNQPVASTRTDGDGNYVLSPAPGNYKVRFKVGDVSDADKNNTDLVKKILKYNGQDYSATAVSKGEITTTNISQETKTTMSQNAVQISFCIDVSGSTWSPVYVYGEEKTVKQVEIGAMKDLVSKLLGSDYEVYMSFIFFDNRIIEKTPMSNDQDELNKVLDAALDKKFGGGGTDIATPLSEAPSMFNDVSQNRVVAVITDGMPNDGPTATYYTLVDLRNSGYKTMSLVVNLGDSDWQSEVDEIFNDTSTDLHLYTTNALDFVNAIVEQLNIQIQNSFEIKQTLETITYNMEFGTEEDKARMIQVSDNFKDGFTWSNTKGFRLIEDYNGSDDQWNEAQDLSNKTYFTVTSTDTYTITSKEEAKDGQYAYQKKDLKGNIIKEAKYKATPQYYNANLKLTEKRAAKLNIKQYVSALKITLANGQTYYSETADWDQAGDVTKIKALVCQMDEELAYGATVEIEYTLRLTNTDSRVVFDEVKIADYTPEGLNYDVNHSLITESGKNSKYWGNEVVNNDEEFAKGIYFNNDESNDKVTTAKNGENVIATLGNVNEGIVTLKLVTSRVIGSSTDLDNIAKENRAEIIEYKTRNLDATIPDSAYQEGTPRRMRASANDMDYGLKRALGISSLYDLNSQEGYLYPGSFEGLDYTSSYNANEVAIIPPTGVKEKK